MDRYTNLKYKYKKLYFWRKRYFMDIVGRYETAIKEYIKN
ncbi:MAG TPA: transposase [Candidatus Coprocola pullicola]|nr:transposase [Candidatus Coprocola pullicola]